MTRLTIAFALGAAWGCAMACGAAGEFECARDDECSLAGTPGICSAGACAYPHPTCPSGYAYPAGASPELAGTCVAGDDDGASAATGAGTGGGTGDNADASPTSAAVDDGDSTGQAGSSGSADATSSMEVTGSVSASDSASESSTGVSQCEDTVGDAVEDEAVFAGCEGGTGETLQSSADEDWYRMGGDMLCPPEAYAASLPEGEGHATICLFAACPDFPDEAPAPTVQCFEGAPNEEFEGLPGCCANELVLASMACGAGGVQLHVRVTAIEGASASCTPYTFMVGIANG